MSLDDDGYYLPFVPPRADADVDDVQDDPPPTSADLEVRHPPVGLSRAERRDFMRDEAARVARVQERARRNPLARKPPRGLGRAGRREWRQIDKAARNEWLARERATRTANAPGALIVAGIIAAVLLARIFLFDSDAPSVQPPAPKVVSTVAPPPTIVIAPRGE